MSTTCCSALSASPRWRTRISASSPSRLIRGPSASCSTFTSAPTPIAAEKRSRNSTMRGVTSLSLMKLAADSMTGCPVALAVADSLRAPFGGGSNCPHVGRPDDTGRQILLPDTDDGARHVVEQRPGRQGEKDEPHDKRHEHHH